MMIPISGQMSKVTSAIWGPYGEYIVTGHENGDLCQFDVKVCLVYFFLYGVSFKDFSHLIIFTVII